MEYIAFFFAIKHVHVDDVEIKLMTYLDEPNQYIISMEKCKDKHHSTDGEHMHVLCTMSAKNYKAYSTLILRTYKLRGKAGDGVGKQYGKVNKIRDLDKMMSYTLKDNNFRTNMDIKQIEQALGNSYKKEEKKEEELKILEFISEKHEIFRKNKPQIEFQHYQTEDPTSFAYLSFGFKEAAIAVIEYFRIKNKETEIRYNLSRNQITTLVNKYFMYMEKNTSPNYLYNIIFSSHNV